MDFRLFFLWVSLVSCHIYCNNFVSNPSASSLPSRVSCYLPLQPFQAIKLHKQSIGFMHIFTLLQESLLLQNDGFNIFNIIIVHWPNSAYLYLQRFVHLQIVSGLICSFRKDILSSIICCRVVIICIVKLGSRFIVISWLALKGEREEVATIHSGLSPSQPLTARLIVHRLPSLIV